MPVSDSNLSDADNPLNGHDVHNTIGLTKSEVEQHVNGKTHSAEQVQEGQNVPNQNVPEDSMKNSDVANGNSVESALSTDSSPSDTKAAVKLATGQKTPEPNAKSQKDNQDSTRESQEQVSKSKSVSEDHSSESKSSRQTEENPTSQEQIPDCDPKPFSQQKEGSKRDEDKMEVSPSQPPGSKNKTCHTQNTTDEPNPETPPSKPFITYIYFIKDQLSIFKLSGPPFP